MARRYRTKLKRFNDFTVNLAVMHGSEPADMELANIELLFLQLTTNQRVIIPIERDTVEVGVNIVSFDVPAECQEVLGDYNVVMHYEFEGQQHSLKTYAVTLVDLSSKQYTNTDPGVPEEVFVTAIVSVNVPPESLRPQIIDGIWWVGGLNTGVPATGPAGEDGVGITNMAINGSGHLIVTLSDGRRIDAGSVYQEGVVTQTDLDAAVTRLQSQITLNQTVISNLQGEVESLRQQVTDRTHFRGTYQESSSVAGIPNPEEGDYVYVLETMTQWNYEAGEWRDTGVGIPNTTIPLSDVLPLPDGTASAGTGNAASREDHVHPADATKQNVLTAGANVTIDNDVISFTLPPEVLQYDADGNVVLRLGTKVLVTTPDGATHEAFGLAQYTRPDGSIYFQFEVNAASSGHLNLNTDNDEVYGIHITVDTPLGKEVLVFESDLVGYKKFISVPSSFVDGEFHGITYSDLEMILEYHSIGYLPYSDLVDFGAYDISDSGASIVMHYSYHYLDVRPTDGYTQLYGYIVTILASEANVIVTPVQIMTPRVSQIPYHLPNEFVTPDTVTNTLPGVTWAMIQDAYSNYLLGKDFSSNIASLYGVPRFVVTADLASIEYDFARVTNNELIRYHASINATEQNVISSVIPTDYDALIQDLRWNSNSASLSGTGDYFDLQIGTTGLLLRARYISQTIINIYWLTTGGNLVVDWKRASIYGGSGQGSFGDGQTISTTEILIDDVLSNSDDLVGINVRVAGQRYFITVFFSGAGARCDMSYIRII